MPLDLIYNFFNNLVSPSLKFLFLFSLFILLPFPERRGGVDVGEAGHVAAAPGGRQVSHQHRRRRPSPVTLRHQVRTHVPCIMPHVS